MSIAIATLIRRHLEEADEGTAEQIASAIGATKDQVITSCSSLLCRGELAKTKNADGLSVFSIAPWGLPEADEIIASAMSRRVPLELAWLKVAR